jgi:hypothetical protein
MDNKLKDKYFDETGVRWYDSLSCYSRWLENKLTEWAQLLNADSKSTYAMDIMLRKIEHELENYKNGKDYLDDYEIDSQITDRQRGYRYCLKGMAEYIKSIGMWQERILRKNIEK